MGAHLHWLLNTCANSYLISSIVKIHGVPSVPFVACHMSGHMNVYSNHVKQYFKEMLDKEIWGGKYYFMYLAFFASVFSVWHLNHSFEVNGVLHNPMVQCLKKIMNILSMKDAKKFVLMLLEHQCIH